MQTSDRQTAGGGGTAKERRKWGMGDLLSLSRIPRASHQDTNLVTEPYLLRHTPGSAKGRRSGGTGGGLTLSLSRIPCAPHQDANSSNFRLSSDDFKRFLPSSLVSKHSCFRMGAAILFRVKAGSRSPALRRDPRTAGSQQQTSTSLVRKVNLV